MAKYVRKSVPGAFSGRGGLQTSEITRRVRDATIYSWQGLKAALRTSTAFRIELTLAAVLVPIALILAQSGVERALLILPIMILLIKKQLNSAIDSAAHRI